MEELLEVQWSEPSETIKQRFKKALGQEIPVDYFMYSCLEEERTFRSLGQEALHSERWSVFRQAEETIVEALKDRPLDELMAELFEWYKEQYPSFTEVKPLDLARLTWFTKYFIILRLDLEKLFALKAPEIADKEPNFSLVKEKLVAHFPLYSHLMLGYLEWSIHTETEANLQIDLASIPPTGRFISLIKRKLRQMRNGFSSARGPALQGSRPSLYESKGRNDRNDRAPSASERGRREFPSRDARQGGARDSSSARDSRPPHRDQNPSRDSRSSGPRDNRFERGRGGERERNDQDGNRNNGNRRGRDNFQRDKRPPATDVEKQNIALAEVDHAIKRLDSEKDLKEIRLKPQNSFVRRLQHQKAVDNTKYASESVGEGADRAVIIQRK